MFINKKVLFTLLIITTLITLFFSKYMFKHNIFYHQKSQIYEDVNNKINRMNNFIKLNNGDTSLLISREDQFIINNPNIYGTLNILKIVKNLVIKNKLEKAIFYLRYALKFTREENLRAILHLRLIRLEIEQKENLFFLKPNNILKNNNWINVEKNILKNIFQKEKNLQKSLKIWKLMNFSQRPDILKNIINF